MVRKLLANGTFADTVDDTLFAADSDTGGVQNGGNLPTHASQTGPSNDVLIPQNNTPGTPAGDANPGPSSAIHNDAAAALALAAAAGPDPGPSVSAHNAAAGSTVTVPGPDGTVLFAMMPVPDLLV
jgi:hypothetical protein